MRCWETCGNDGLCMKMYELECSAQSPALATKTVTTRAIRRNRVCDTATDCLGNRYCNEGVCAIPHADIDCGGAPRICNSTSTV